MSTNKLKFSDLDVQERLRSNQLLSQTQRNEIRSYIRSAESDASALRRRVYAFHNEERQLQYHISQCRSLLSPIRRLPTETLSHILTFCKDNYITPDGPNTLISGLAFELVCHHWRRVALATTALWSTLSLKPPPDTVVRAPKQAGRATKLTELLLQKSKTEPLDITLVIEELSLEEEFRAIFPRIQAEAYRWKALRIYSSARNGPHNLLKEVHIRALHTLSIALRHDPDDFSIHHHLITPSLKVLKICLHGV